MDSFIVRIYRYDQARPRAIVGTVEHAGGEGKRAFANMEELWDILNPMKTRGTEDYSKKSHSEFSHETSRHKEKPYENI